MRSSYPIRTFWALIAVFLVVNGVHWLWGGLSLDSLRHRVEYDYVQSLRLESAPGAFRVAMYLPAETASISRLDESFDARDLRFRTEDLDTGRQLIVEGDGVFKPREFRYVARLRSVPVEFHLDAGLEWDELNASDEVSLASTEIIQTGSPEVVARLRELFSLSPVDNAMLNADLARSLQLELDEQGITPTDAIGRCFAHCLQDISPANFSGTTDALTALRLGEASCGGKSRLMTALLRTLGIPTRLVGGVLLTGGAPKRTSHVWVECRLRDQWVPFDPLNNHLARLPAGYIRLYHGDEALMRHSRGLAFDYSFWSRREHSPAVWGDEMSAAAPQRIPLLRRDDFSLLLLAPFALLLTVFLRQVVGLGSIGTFLPVLLGYSLLQTGWLLGGLQILAALAVGVLLRGQLGRLTLLHVPRTAVMISLLVFLFLLASVFVQPLTGVTSGSRMLLPLAALAMAIERVNTVASDRGAKEAAWLLAQTAILAVACCIVLGSAVLKTLTLAVPEALLVVMAEIILIGSYRGLRVSEWVRFRGLLGGSQSGSVAP